MVDGRATEIIVFSFIDTLQYRSVNFMLFFVS